MTGVPYRHSSGNGGKTSLVFADVKNERLVGISRSWTGARKERAALVEELKGTVNGCDDREKAILRRWC